MGEIQRGIENVEFASYATELLKGEHSRNVGPNIDAWTELQALGVTAGITPFNFPRWCRSGCGPMAVACGKHVRAEALGRDPSSAMFILQLAVEARPAAGRLNVSTATKGPWTSADRPPRPGHQLRRLDPDCRVHLFEGLPGGQARTGLGGAKNHAVVMPDADILNAVNALMGAAYGSCGERCMAIPLVVAVGDATADAVVAGLVDGSPR